MTALFYTTVLDGSVIVRHLITGRVGKVVGKQNLPFPPKIDGAAIGEQSNVYRVDFGLAHPAWAQDYNLEVYVAPVVEGPAEKT